MSSVGLVGGLGPESTIDYYRRILSSWESRHSGSSPSLLIDSLDVQVGIRLAEHDHAGLTGYLLDSIRRLAGAGVDFVALTANTAHLVFDELAAQAPVPLLSIVEVTAQDARRQGLERPGLLGTRFTMQADFYPEVFRRYGMEVVAPDAGERDWLHQRYIGQLLKGDFREETRAGVISLVERLRERERIDGVILGGTELPLLLRAPTIAGLPLLDTTELHVAAIVARLEG